MHFDVTTSRFIYIVRMSSRIFNREELEESAGFAASDRFSGSVIVVRSAHGDAARLQMSTAFMTLHRVLSVVAFDVLALPAYNHLVRDKRRMMHIGLQYEIQSCTFYLRLRDVLLRVASCFSGTAAKLHRPW